MWFAIFVVLMIIFSIVIGLSWGIFLIIGGILIVIGIIKFILTLIFK